MSKQSSLYTTKNDWMNDIGQYTAKAKEYVEQLDHFLEVKTSDNVVAYITLFQDKAVMEHYVGCSTDLAYAYIFAVVSVDEINRYGGIRFLFAGQSVAELIRKFKEIEFALWELEFEVENAAMRLWQEIDVPYVTPQLIKSAILVSSMDKSLMFTKVIQLYKQYGNVQYAEEMDQYYKEYIKK